MCATKLNRMQKSFVDIYLAQRKTNQKEAAIKAGYSPRSAESQASQLLKNPKVRQYLEEQETMIASDLRKEFIFDALEARKVMYSIMKNPASDDKDRIAVAKDFLDRAGFKPTDKQQISLEGVINNPFEDLTTAELKKLISDG